jgi:hypothetical protein
MLTEPITQDLAVALAHVAETQELHKQAQAFDAAQQRTFYMHSRFVELECTLLALRLVASLAARLPGGSEVTQLRRATLSDIRRTRPQSIERLGKSLVNNDLELLRLAEYVAASIALLHERIASAAAIVRSTIDKADLTQGSASDEFSAFMEAADYLAKHKPLGPEQYEELLSLTRKDSPPVP